jgi:hypothetical protein
MSPFEKYHVILLRTEPFLRISSANANHLGKSTPYRLSRRLRIVQEVFYFEDSNRKSCEKIKYVSVNSNALYATARDAMPSSGPSIRAGATWTRRMQHIQNTQHNSQVFNCLKIFSLWAFL